MAIHSNLLGDGVAGNITISDATNGDAVTTMYFCNTHEKLIYIVFISLYLFILVYKQS